MYRARLYEEWLTLIHRLNRYPPVKNIERRSRCHGTYPLDKVIGFRTTLILICHQCLHANLAHVYNKLHPKNLQIFATTVLTISICNSTFQCLFFHDRD